MSNSSLVNYTKISPNKTVMSNKKIKKITIHHMACIWSVQRCGESFALRSRNASSNYGIDSDGNVGLYVDEKDRAWTSSSSSNDSQAVTIEVSNDTIGGDWHVSDKALAKLIDLCTDICIRNGIPKLNFTGDKNGNLTMHCYFAATACPGPYLKSKFPYIASEVNKRLAGGVPSQPTPVPSPTVNYKVRKSWSDALSQKGAFSNLENAKKCADQNPGYSVFDNNGNVIYTNNPAPVVPPPAPAPQPEPSKPTITKGARVNLSNTPIYTSSSAKTAVKRLSGTYYLWDANVINNKIRITNAANKVGVASQITGWVNVSSIGFDGSTPVSKPNPTKALTAGTKVKLSNASLYASSSTKKSAAKKSGTYYIHSANVINGRIRITNSAANVGTNNVTGWVLVSACK